MPGCTAASPLKSRALNTLRYAMGIFMMAAFFASPTMASTIIMTYTYTGNDFMAVAGPYTTADYISGFFTYATLPGDFNGAINPISYSFSDGVETLDNENSFIVLFDVVTSSTGAITGWYIDLGLDPDSYLWTWDNPSLSPWAEDGSQLENAPSNGGGLNDNDPGSWAASSSVPEPSSAVLMPVALLAMACVARKRVRRMAR